MGADDSPSESTAVSWPERISAGANAGIVSELDIAFDPPVPPHVGHMAEEEVAVANNDDDRNIHVKPQPAAEIPVATERGF